jgi:phosphoribosylformylglycinamidine cyclo-ligase
MKPLLEEQFNQIHGLVHCSGGGQTKCLKYVGEGLRIIKDNLFKPPQIFDLIQQASGSDNREMYQVFNMGHRMEIFTTNQGAPAVIALASRFNIDAQIVGRVEAGSRKELILQIADQQIQY